MDEEEKGLFTWPFAEEEKVLVLIFDIADDEVVDEVDDDEKSGRLNLSSAIVTDEDELGVDVGSVCLHFRLRPFMPVVKAHVPFHGERKL